MPPAKGTMEYERFRESPQYELWRAGIAAAAKARGRGHLPRGRGLGWKHTEATKAKMSASAMGRAPTFLGRKHSQETRLKISLASKGHPKSPEHRLALQKPKSAEHKSKISAALLASEKFKQFWNRWRSEYKKLVSARMRGNQHAKGHKHTEEFKLRRRAEYAGKTNLPWADPAFRERMREVSSQNALAVRRSRKRTRYQYLDRRGRLHKMLSSWEIAYAQYLDLAELTWDYEPVLRLSTGRRYLPDFWVREWKTYVELKGPMSSAEKVDQAIADGYKVRLIRKPEDFGATKEVLAKIREECAT